MPRTAALGIIVLLFLAFGAGYILQTPYRTAGIVVFQGGAKANDIGAPDERQHANYIQRLQEGKGFAVLDPNDPSLYENYQAHQPPLYYLVGAGAATLAGAKMDKPSGANLRWLNLAIGAATLLGLFWLVLWGTGREDAALGAATLCLMPMFVALHSAITNDPLLFCLMTWCLACAVKASLEKFAWGWVTAAGALLGLALLTKTTALALLPALAVLGLSSMTAAKTPWPRVFAAIGIGLAMALPWLIRNQSLYGDPFALGAFQDSFKGSAQASAFIAQYGADKYWLEWVGLWTARSFVGVFGYMDIYLFEQLGPDRFNLIYFAVLFLVGLVMLGGVFGGLRIVAAAKKKGEGEEGKAPAPGYWLTMFVLLAVVAALFVQFNRTYFQGQARYLYPAVAGLASLWGAGLALLEGRLPKWSWAAGAVLLAIINIIALLQLGPAFAARVAIGG